MIALPIFLLVARPLIRSSADPDPERISQLYIVRTHIIVWRVPAARCRLSWLLPASIGMEFAGDHLWWKMIRLLGCVPPKKKLKETAMVLVLPRYLESGVYVKPKTAVDRINIHVPFPVCCCCSFTRGYCRRRQRRYRKNSIEANGNKRRWRRTTRRRRRVRRPRDVMFIIIA